VVAPGVSDIVGGVGSSESPLSFIALFLLGFGSSRKSMSFAERKSYIFCETAGSIRKIFLKENVISASVDRASTTMGDLLGILSFQHAATTCILDDECFFDDEIWARQDFETGAKFLLFDGQQCQCVRL
jgi:hypothetical protein